MANENMVTSTNGFVDAIGKDFSTVYATINPIKTPTLTYIIERNGVNVATDTIIQRVLKTLSKTGASGGKAEGAEAGAAEKSTKTPVKNVLEIFSKVAMVAGTAKAMSKGAFDEEVTDRIAEIKEDINYNAINGTYSEGANRSMKGMLNFAKHSVAVADVLTEAELDEAIQKVETKGHLVLAVSNADIFKVQGNLIGDRATLQLSADSTTAGVKIWNYNSAQGDVIEIYTEPALPAGTCMLYDIDKVEYYELRPVHFEELDKSGDYDRAQCIGEVTVLPNPGSIVKLAKG